MKIESLLLKCCSAPADHFSLTGIVLCDIIVAVEMIILSWRKETYEFK